MDDCTDYCVRDAGEGPGDYVKRFRAAAPAKVLSDAQARAVAKYTGQALDYVSKALVYDNTFRNAPKPELRALYSAIKGGHLRVVRTAAGYQLVAP